MQTEDQEQTGGMDALDRIGLEAAQEEAEAERTEQEFLNPTPEGQIDPALAWAQIPKMVGGIFAMALPEVASAYTDAACMQWGGAMAMVADKHGWDAAETMGRFAPEIALAVASFPLVVPVVVAIKKKRAEAAENAPKLTTELQEPTIEAEAISDGELKGGNFDEPV